MGVGCEGAVVGAVGAAVVGLETVGATAFFGGLSLLAVVMVVVGCHSVIIVGVLEGGVDGEVFWSWRDGEAGGFSFFAYRTVAPAVASAIAVAAWSVDSPGYFPFHFLGLS